jgi:hypothetical protein
LGPGEVVYEKTGQEKSRDTVPLMLVKILYNMFQEAIHISMTQTEEKVCLLLKSVKFNTFSKKKISRDFLHLLVFFPYVTLFHALKYFRQRRRICRDIRRFISPTSPLSQRRHR